MANIFSGLYEIAKVVKADQAQLDEAVSTFNELPAAWKKHATTQGLGGAGSTVKTLATSTKALKTVDAIEKQLRIALNPGSRVGDEGATLIWVEVNGDPLFSVYRPAHEENTVYLNGPEGTPATVTKHEKQYGTGKWDKRTQKYVPEKYYTRQERAMKPTEAVSVMFQGVNATIRAMNASLPEPHKDHFDVITADNVKIEIKSLSVDKGRIAVKQGRVAARGKDVQVYKNVAAPSNASLRANRKEALKKFVGQKITPVVDSIKADLASQIDAAIESGGKIDLSGIEAKLKTVSSITGQLNRLVAKDNVEFAKGTWSDNNKKLSYDMSYLVSALKSLSEEVDRS